LISVWSSLQNLELLFYVPHDCRICGNYLLFYCNTQTITFTQCSNESNNKASQSGHESNVVCFCEFFVWFLRKYLTKNTKSHTFQAFATILTTVLPTSYMTYAVSTCSPHVLGSVLSAWNLTFGPALNPCLAIYFIRPYRHTLLHWLRLRRASVNNYAAPASAESAVQTPEIHKPSE
jgi:hypothetical protein